MSIDMRLFCSLSEQEQNEWKTKISADLNEKRDDLENIEQRIKEVIRNKDTPVADLTPILNYRDELNKSINGHRCDLDKIADYNNNDQSSADAPQQVAVLLGNAGVVNIRADVTRTRPIPGALTYDEIRKKQLKDAEDRELEKLKSLIKKMSA